jgi:SAM-dependent methyltransferase
MKIPVNSANRNNYTAYGQAFAAVYDFLYTEEAESVVDFVTKLKRSSKEKSRILELAVGTGRLAIPLAAAGFQVTGVDVSEDMLDACRAKRQGNNPALLEGDITSLEFLALGTFDVILLAFNSLFHLTSFGDQLAGLRTIAHHLAPEGVAVVETTSIDRVCPRRRFDGELRSRLRSSLTLRLRIRHGDQRVSGFHLDIGIRRINIRQFKHRYLTLQQLDDMAATCGLVLRYRQQGWKNGALATKSDVVSLYELGGKK